MRIDMTLIIVNVHSCWELLTTPLRPRVRAFRSFSLRWLGIEAQPLFLNGICVLMVRQ